MLGTYYYHEIIRKTIISFGTLFNQIHIRHKDGDNNNISDMRVPLAYGPVQKFLARLEQQSDLNKPIQITLPRMSFEMVSIQYDATRKSSITQTFKVCDGANIKKVFMSNENFDSLKELQDAENNQVLSIIYFKQSNFLFLVA